MKIDIKMKRFSRTKRKCSSMVVAIACLWSMHAVAHPESATTIIPVQLIHVIPVMVVNMSGNVTSQAMRADIARVRPSADV